MEPVYEFYMWLATFLGAAALIFFAVFNVVSVYDLESDIVNPYDFSAKVNSLVFPEYILHWGMTLLFMFVGQWLPFVLNLPLAFFNANKLWKVQHFLDVTQVCQILEDIKREGFVKLGFHLVCTIFYVYNLVKALVVVMRMESVFQHHVPGTAL